MEKKSNYKFKSIFKFLKDYGYEKYQKPEKAGKDTPQMQKIANDGHMFCNSFHDFCMEVAQNTPYLKYAGPRRSWLFGNGVTIRDYYWVELKNSKWLSSPISVSLSIGRSDEIEIRVELHDDNAKGEESLKLFRLLDLDLQDGMFYRVFYRDKRPRADYYADQAEILKSKKADPNISKIQVIKCVENVIEKEKDGNLLEAVVSTVNKIYPFYEHVMSSESVAEDSNGYESANSRYWLYSPGENASNWDELYDAGIIGIGWDLIGDLSKYNSQDDIDNALQKTVDSNSSQKINAKALWQFANDMKPGDIVYAKKGTGLIIGKGIVKSDYLFDEDRTELKHIRKIDWINKGEWVNPASAIRKTLTEITLQEADKLNAAMGANTVVNLGNNDSKYWLLVTNPKNWSFSDIPVGGMQSFSRCSPSGRARPNFSDIKPGDIAICYESVNSNIVALATISTKNENEIEVKKEEQLQTPISKALFIDLPEFTNAEFITVNFRSTYFKLTKEQYDTLIDIIRDNNPIVESSNTSRYTEDNFLKDVYIEKGQYQDLIGVLKYKKNIILQGAPGVGKTYLAKRLAWSMMGERDESRVKLIQFHQNYSYEDFIMGYKPVDSGFDLIPGVFYNFCEMARSQPDKDFFLIIDEINRGNVSKIFGELLMIIENEYRKESITLPYRNINFRIPERLYIIGTMNTADRSLAMIDYALRRRFSFFDIQPCFGYKENDKINERFQDYLNTLNSPILNRLIQSIQELNADIVKSLGKGFCIGHSYFSNLSIEDCSTERLKRIVDYEIIPMIKEYWFDNTDMVNKWEKALRAIF